MATEKRTTAQWLQALRGTGPEREAALADLRDYLLRAVYLYLSRHRSDLAHFDPQEIQQLSQDWTQEAVLSIINKLDTFRGDSQFTTWAYRVVINLAAGELRRRRWQSVSLEALRDDTETAAIDVIEDLDAPDPEVTVQRRELWRIVNEIIQHDLTERQRMVLVDGIFNEVPVEELARRLGTNQNNVYKIYHDARRNLKKRLQDYGLTEAEVLATFGG